MRTGLTNLQPQRRDIMSEVNNELNEMNTTQTDHEYGASEIQVL